MIDFDALTLAMAQEAWDEEAPTEGHVDAAYLMLPVAVAAITDEVRKLHPSDDEPTSQHYYCEPYECDRAGEGEVRPYCRECQEWAPCPTVDLCDEIDTAAGVTR